MSKKQISKLAKEYVKNNKREDIIANPDAFALYLVNNGISFAMAARTHREALQKQGIELPKFAGVKTLQEVRDAIKKHFDENAEAKKPINYNTYKSIRVYAESLEDEFPASFNSCLKCIKDEMGERGMVIPSKVKLGNVKEAICDYFASERDHSLTDLTKYLQDNVVIADGDEEKPMTADKAVLNARMYFTFGQMLSEGLTVSDMN